VRPAVGIALFVQAIRSMVATIRIGQPAAATASDTTMARICINAPEWSTTAAW